MKRKRIIIAGATSSMAEHCARIWLAREAVDLVLIGRDAQRVERVASDIRVRSPLSVIQVVEADFLDHLSIRNCVDRLFESAEVDVALIAHGHLPNQESCQNDLTVCREELEVNGVSPVLFAEAFARNMEKADHGTLAIIGSVAGDRGRRSNYVYGAAKGLIERYAQGLQHRFAKSEVNVVLIKPGPTATPMTANLNNTNLANVNIVAGDICSAIEKHKLVAYTPKKWRLIMWVIRNMPSLIFNKLDI